MVNVYYQSPPKKVIVVDLVNKSEEHIGKNVKPKENFKIDQSQILRFAFRCRKCQFLSFLTIHFVSFQALISYKKQKKLVKQPDRKMFMPNAKQLISTYEF